MCSDLAMSSQKDVQSDYSKNHTTVYGTLAINITNNVSITVRDCWFMKRTQTSVYIAAPPINKFFEPGWQDKIVLISCTTECNVVDIVTVPNFEKRYPISFP